MADQLLPYRFDQKFRPGVDYVLRLTGGPAGWLDDYTFAASLGGTALAVTEDDDDLVITITDTVTTAKATPEWSTFLLSEAAQGVVIVGRWEPSQNGTLAPSNEVPIVLGTIEIPVTLLMGPAGATGGGAPSGPAGGVLSGTYPDPGFAADMATQAELNAEATTRGNADTALATSVSNEATARANADLLLIPLTQKGAANGVATLGADSKIPSAQLPALAIGEVFTVASQAAMLALTAQRGDIAVRTDLNPDGVFILTTDAPGTLADWVQITAPGAVISVDGQTGVVSLSATYAPLSALNESLLTVPSSGATETFDADDYDGLHLTVDANCVLTITTTVQVRTVVLVVNGDGVALRTLTLPGGVVLPVPADLAEYVVTARTQDTGATWEFYAAGRPGVLRPEARIESDQWFEPIYDQNGEEVGHLAGYEDGNGPQVRLAAGGLADWVEHIIFYGDDHRVVVGSFLDDDSAYLTVYPDHFDLYASSLTGSSYALVDGDSVVIQTPLLKLKAAAAGVDGADTPSTLVALADVLVAAGLIASHTVPNPTAYTTEAIQDIVGALLAGSTGITVAYDDAGNVVNVTLSADLIDLISRWVPASASGPTSLDFHEDTDNGSNKVTVTAPAALAADRTLTLPDATGIVGLAPLAMTVYNPGTKVSLDTTSTSFVDADATNLAITFTAPTSGQVLVRLSGFYDTVGAAEAFWGLRDGASTVAGSLGCMGLRPDLGYRGVHICVVTGLTPGNSYTWKWAHATSTSTLSLIVGGGDNPASGAPRGPATMEVFAK